MSTPTALYRLFGEDDALLYVGVAKTFGPRWHQHAHSQPWWHEVRRQSVDWYPSREEAETAERAAIKAERPKYNKQHNEDWGAPRRSAKRELKPEPTAADVAFGERARQARTAAGLSQALVARSMSARGHRWHQTTVQRIEAGSQRPDVCEELDLAGVLRVPWESFHPDLSPAVITMMRVLMAPPPDEEAA